MNEQAIHDLMAESAIRQKLYRYCHSIDRLDHEMGYGVFAADGLADYGAWYTGEPKGLIDTIIDFHANGLKYTSHQITNVLLKVDGDRAASEAYCTLALEGEADGKPTLKINRVRYNDLWECRDGDWVIVKRVMSSDISYSVGGKVNVSRGNSSRGDQNDGSCGILF